MVTLSRRGKTTAKPQARFCRTCRYFDRDPDGAAPPATATDEEVQVYRARGYCLARSPSPSDAPCEPTRWPAMSSLEVCSGYVSRDQPRSPDMPPQPDYCVLCDWFIMDPCGEPPPPDADKGEREYYRNLGRCLRNVPHSNGGVIVYFPIVHRMNRCGEGVMLRFEDDMHDTPAKRRAAEIDDTDDGDV